MLPLRKYEHVFFDLDHTLWDFDTNSKETLRDLYNELELQSKGILQIDQFLSVYHRFNLLFWDRFRRGYINRDELRWKRMWRTLVEFRITDMALARNMSERYLEILPTKKSLFHDTVETLEYLKQKKYPIHLITNGFEKTQHLKIRNSGIDHYFTHVITSENAGIMKPHAAIFEFAMEKAGTFPHHSLMIGDTLDADIEGGNNAGIDTVYFNPAEPPSGSITPTYIIANLSDLKKIL